MCCVKTHILPWQGGFSVDADTARSEAGRIFEVRNPSGGTGAWHAYKEKPMDEGGRLSTHRIVVGTDGSAAGWAAVRWAATQAVLTGAELRIVTAFGPDRDFVGHDDAKDHMDEVIDQATGEATEVAPGLTITSEEHFGPPGTALQDESGRADLLVVGSRGKGGFAGLLLGSVSRQCAHRSRCPVVVVRHSDGDGGAVPTNGAGSAAPVPAAHRIVVGVDGSTSSTAALEWAVSQAEATGASLQAFMAWDWMTTYGWGFVIPPDLDPAADSARALERALGPVRNAHPGLALESSLVEGPAAKLLVEASSGADLLVVGNRGHGELVEILLGSVGEYCVAHAPCPVVVVHQPATPSAA
jgi:nucleotide-binding universal stress UspA family protein